CNDSWGGGPGVPFFEDFVRAWSAAGIFPAFANGNSGPGCGTAASPADYPESYASGAFDANDAIWGSSSRGPSSFGVGLKPNITAPGVNVRSSVPGAAYKVLSGTSMASPHTTATVALLWAASPSLFGDID